MQLYFLLTENCNLNCAMCIRGGQDGASIDYDTAKYIVEHNKLKEHNVVITGGEPTLNADFVKIIKLFCEVSRTVTVTTNGIFDYYVEDLQGIDNLLFQISLDGDEAMHDSIRGVGSFEKTFNTITEFEQRKYRYVIASVVGKRNKSCIEKLIPKLSMLNSMLYWRVSYEMPFGSAIINYSNIMKASEWNEFVDEIIPKAKFRLQIKKIFPFELYDKNKDNLELYQDEIERNTNCGSGKKKLYIYPNLKVYPCTCLTDFCIGDLNEKSIDEIIHSKENQLFFHYEISQESECDQCEYMQFCKGGCIGMSYHFQGKLGLGDIRCPKVRKHE